jgi:GNAT superfamily N-acetyltransferase
MRRRALSSVLLQRAWRLPDETLCRVRLPGRERLRQVDAEWPPLRAQSDASRNWSWTEIAKRSKEVFALVASDARTLALWSSNNPTAEMEGRVYYVASKLEVRPDARKLGAGQLSISLIGHRAWELGCSAVVLNAPAERWRMYLNAGATMRTVRGWTVPWGLASMVFEGRGLSRLMEAHDELLEEG